MVDVRVLRVVFTLVVRGCRAFKLLVLLVGVEGVVTIVLFVMVVVMLVVCGSRLLFKLVVLLEVLVVLWWP